MRTGAGNAALAVSIALAASVSCWAAGEGAPLRETRGAQVGATTVTIGLLLGADGPRATEAQELRRGAEIAAEEYAAQPVRVVMATSAAQWNAGAGELIRLVYSEGIGAVLGPADGRTAHLAEQVAARAKGRFVLLTPWATDPTLTRVKVPWFFRLAPDDLQQAKALLEEIHGVCRLRNAIVVVAETDYDCRQAAGAFERAAKARGAAELYEIRIRDGAGDVTRLTDEALSRHAEAVILLAPPAAAARATRSLREAGITAPFFGPLGLASPAFLDTARDAAEGMVLAAPPEPSGSVGEHFRATYRKAHGREPSVPSAYGYDGAAVLIDALHATGNRGAGLLRAALAATHRDGMTGRIQFDASGNRTGPALLARVERGRLRELRRSGLGTRRPSTLSPVP